MVCGDNAWLIHGGLYISRKYTLHKTLKRAYTLVFCDKLRCVDASTFCQQMGWAPRGWAKFAGIGFSQKTAPIFLDSLRIENGTHESKESENGGGLIFIW